MPRFGVSFVPDGQNGNDPQKQGGPTDRYQEAVKILSLRLPKLRGAMGGGIAPAPLLNAPGAMGQPQTAMGGGQPINSEVAQAFLQMAGMGQPGQRRRPQGLMSGPRAPQAAPRVVPGIDQLPNGVPNIPPITREWDQPLSTYDVPESAPPTEFPTPMPQPEPVMHTPIYDYTNDGGSGDTPPPLEGQDGLNYFDLLRRRMNGGY